MHIIDISLNACSNNSLLTQVINTARVVYLLIRFYLVKLKNKAFKLYIENSCMSSGFKSNGSTNSHLSSSFNLAYKASISYLTYSTISFSSSCLSKVSIGSSFEGSKGFYKYPLITKLSFVPFSSPLFNIFI